MSPTSRASRRPPPGASSARSSPGVSGPPPAPRRARTVLGMEFRFVRCKRSDVFGTAELWVDKREKIVVSDVERTVVDGLKQPEHCGGLTEVAKGLSMRRTRSGERRVG